MNRLYLNSNNTLSTSWFKLLLWLAQHWLERGGRVWKPKNRIAIAWRKANQHSVSKLCAMIDHLPCRSFQHQSRLTEAVIPRPQRLIKIDAKKHLPDDRCSVYENVGITTYFEKINLNALRIVKLYGLSSNLASYVPSYERHESKDQRASKDRGNLDQLQAMPERYHDELRRLGRGTHHH